MPGGLTNGKQLVPGEPFGYLCVAEAKVMSPTAGSSMLPMWGRQASQATHLTVIGHVSTSMAGGVATPPPPDPACTGLRP